MACVEEGFRLIGPPSECSLRSKARIDALFEDSRSICSSTFAGWYGEIGPTATTRAPTTDVGTEEQRRVNSAVQARIEAMFASVEAETGTPGEAAAAILPVKYMGAAPVGGRVASVRGLQEPLRQLVERIEMSVTAELEVSRRGLTYRATETCEKNNPFRRIAVWSALRLRCKRRPNGDYHHAFVPLVGDQESGQPVEDRHADLYRTMRGLRPDTETYPAIFAVVMRRPGAARLLECHGFACECDEDAVAAAATLYRALLADLDATRRRPRQTNGVGRASLASVASSACESSHHPVLNGTRHSRRTESRLATSASRPVLVHDDEDDEDEEDEDDRNRRPVRPPRTKKGHSTSTTTTATATTTTTTMVVDEVRTVQVVGADDPGKVARTTRRKEEGQVNEEDILEARGRRRETKVYGQSACSNSIVSKGSTDATTNRCNAPASKQDWQNARNDKPKKSKSPSGEDTDRSERIYEKEEKPGGSDIYERCSNLYERVATKSEREARMRADVVVENAVATTSSRGRYEPSEATSRSSVERTSRAGSYATRAEPSDLYDRVEKGSIYEDERFRDVDKICSIPEPESRVDERRSRSRSRCSSRPEATAKTRPEAATKTRPEAATKTRPEPAIKAQPATKTRPEVATKTRLEAAAKTRRPAPARPTDTRESRRGLARVATMDKPLRRPHSVEHLSDHVAPPSTAVAGQSRKRSRAGSEPPTSRLETIESAATTRPEATRLKRSQSDLDVDRGDLMTRVELPRRGSFLHSGSTRRPNNVNGGTPLGFTELFDEFRNQEGLTSVDDILAAIIDPEGMSFNDLKPLYKEFLLKLAATLTQDELYQRSASIMRRRRRPQRRRSTRRPCLLGRAIKRSVSRLRAGPTEFTSVIFPARRLNDSFGSSSSCDAKNLQRGRVLASRHGRRRSSWKATRTGHCHTTSEDSDTCRRLTRSTAATANRSSSGYVSCSECSYDSESCTCVSADKCYCSLTRRRVGPETATTTTTTTTTTMATTAVPANAVPCGCDTDSCSESNKCYCARRPVQQPSILEQLRQRGIVPTESTLSRAGSPLTAAKSRNGRARAASRSLELLQVDVTATTTTTTCGSSDNLALDYDLFSPGRKSQASSGGGEKILVVSARDTQGRLVYVGGTERDERRTSRAEERHHEALSIKKSAEIAAVFGADASRMCRRVSNASSLRSSVSLEAGLGYLP